MNVIRQIIKNSKGQTLIEALVALGVAGIVISAITIVLNSSLGNAQFSKDQNQATHYAEEGMEYMRKIRNQDWTNYSETFPPPDANQTVTVKCLNKKLEFSNPLSGSNSCDQQNVDNFIRTVRVEENSCACGSNQNDSKNIRRVTVSVAWSDSKCIIPTPTPACKPNGIESTCTENIDCCSGSCIAANSKKSNEKTCGFTVGSQAYNEPTPTPTSPPCNSAIVDTSDQNEIFCHQTQLSSCFSDIKNIQAPE